MLKNKITNMFIILFLIGTLIFAFFLADKKEGIKKEYFSKTVFNQIHEEIKTNRNKGVTEKHILLKENKNFNPFKKKDLIEFVEQYDKQQMLNTILILYLYNDRMSVDVINKEDCHYAKYYKKDEIKYVEINKEVGLYENKKRRFVLFPKTIDYIDFSKIGGYNI